MNDMMKQSNISNSHLNMRRNNINMRTMAQRVFLCCLLFWCFAGNTQAQNDPQYVIKWNDTTSYSPLTIQPHYLSRVYNSSTNKWVTQDATEFSPSCVWYSGNTSDNTGINHNYYFMDNGTYHFLSAHFGASANLNLSDSLPSQQMLRNTEQNYYFYDWDWDNPPIDGAGVARGIQNGSNWVVYWAECNNGAWKMSSNPSYNITNKSGRFRLVTVTDFINPISGGLTNLNVNVGGTATPTTGFEMEFQDNKELSASVAIPYKYIAYTSYVFEGGTHNYYCETVGGTSLDHGSSVPPAVNGEETSVTSYQWVISGPGAQYLSFTQGSNQDTVISNSSTGVTLYYRVLNETGHKTATLTFTVTYSNGATQVRTATVTVKTPCGNPLQLNEPVVTYDHVTVSWVNTSDQYRLGLKKKNNDVWHDTIEVSNANSYTFAGLEYSTDYQYRVTAYCNGTIQPNPGTTYEFTTKQKPDLLVNGSVFGGGRLADVTGNTEVVIINSDTIGAVYGGNDIAGSVLGLDGSTIILGIDASEATNSYAQLYNAGHASTKVRVNDVYGGGNGYYSYNGSTFVPATSYTDTVTIAGGASVTALSASQQWNDTVWSNPYETRDTLLAVPGIVKSTIVVTNDQVKVDSLFGGAKNAFMTHIIGYEASGKPIYAPNGDSISIHGGTILAVFGGNNVGGSQGNGKHRIHVTNTTTHLEDSIYNTATTGFGRDFGIRYLFGGGNKVAGSTTDVTIVGGQCDTVFGGGNEADVYAANIEVNCELGPYSSQHPYTYGAAYSNAINSAYFAQNYTGPASFNDIKMIDTVNYEWNGFGGIYNVRTLFGGSNFAAMNGVPTVNLTSGSIGTVYGGGNAGDMLSHKTTGEIIPDTLIKYGTHVVMNSPTLIIDYLYGGCQVSNVDFSTWVEIKNGHVGSVYGGCNVSGDVGSTVQNDTLVKPAGFDNLSPLEQRPFYLEYQKVQGATYVEASGGIIYKNLFAGSNGYYGCNDGIQYTHNNLNYSNAGDRYIGLPIPTHNETYVMVRPGATIKGNVYAGGNMASVGFTNTSVGNPTLGYKPYPQFVGLSSVHMSGGTVDGDVYGGGNMAAVYGSDEVQVSGGTINGALYGGNDKLGMVAQITSRALPDSYNLASDGNTPLTNVRTYVSVTGKPKINTVYGGGNGDYIYSSDLYCEPDNLPIQSYIFVDINIDGFPNETEGGHINTVYGGGNGVTINGSTTVMLNVKGADDNTLPVAYDHVGTIFGGNNKGHLNILADIILLKGQVNTVYGGCNKGAMAGDKTYKVLLADAANSEDSTTFEHVGSVVRLRDKYTVKNTVASPAIDITTPTAGVVSGAVYGGCRMNGVNNNSLVIVEGGTHGKLVGEAFKYATIYGGNDIKGDVGGTSRVIVLNGDENAPIVGDVYGGGNGHYDFDGHNVYLADSTHIPSNLVATDTADVRPPYSVKSRVDMQGGTIANAFAGGFAGVCGVTEMQVNGGLVNERIFGGGNLAGVVFHHELDTTNIHDELGHATVYTTTIDTTGTSTVIVNGGQVKGGIFGGDNLADSVAGPVNVYIYGGTLGTSAIPMADGIYGGGYGVNTGTLDNVTVTIGGTVGEQTYVPTIYGDVYGGSALGQVNKPGGSNLTQVDFMNGALHGKLYGGGMGNTTDSTLVNGNVQVNINGGNLFDDIYGGCNYKGGVTGDIAVNVKSGIVGSNLSDDCAQADVFGGGFGHSTATSGNVVVTIDTVNSTTPAPIIYGDVYGGSGYGDVNELNANDSTIVNVLNGTIARISCDGTTYFGGNVYGGGLGQNQIGDDPATNYPAHVNGKVFVNIGKGNGTDCNPDLKGNATIEGSVYGCNNVNGTPLDSVFVNIYKTAHVHDPHDNYYIEIPNTGLSTETDSLNWLEGLPHDTVNYAISSVYGGGNRAAYTPPLTEDGLPRCATVHVWGCKENTIYDVYGGGNAANVGDTTANGKPANTRVIIDGGRIHQMFGGGNGYSSDHNHTDPTSPTYNPGANIFGTASSYIYAGLIDEVYGGANQWGSIDTIDLNVRSSECCKAAIYGKVFGCANEAPINHSISTTVECGVGPIGELYGGSNLADIGMDDNTEANVTLNVYGGKYQSVFGGSKGRRPGTNSPSDLGKTAHIHGNVTLNIYGGTIVKAFGGTDQYGNVFGTITVNVDTIYSRCPAVIDTVFGAGDLTYYTPTKVNGQLITSPRVNIINGTVRKAVYGAGKGETAITRANPLVIIGDTVATHANNANRLAIVGDVDGVGDVYGGGYAGEVKGGPTVNVVKSNTVVLHRVFGGGDMASVDSTLTTTVNVYDGTIGYGIYGGCHTSGTVADSIAVNILGGKLGTSTAKMPEGIFGGGFGDQTKTDDNIFVNIEIPNTDTVFADVYGGSAFGEVGATGTLAKVEVKNGSTVKGKIFGGGKGSGTDNGNYSATVTGNTELAIQGTVLDSIFGGCNVHGVVEGNTLVGITGSGRLGSSTPAILANAYGGGLGENTKVKGDIDVTIDGNTATIYGDVYGGSAMGLVNCNNAGNAQNGYAKTNVSLKNGAIHGDLYGGGHGINDKAANVWGPVNVSVEGGSAFSVFGCNNLSGAPMDTVIVEVSGGVMDSVFGGGNVAAYTAPYITGSNTIRTNYPYVHVSGGEVTHKVVGGGNAANVTGNPYVLISDGTNSPTIGTDTLASVGKGVYGGCNTSGIVTGNTLVELVGGIIGVQDTTNSNYRDKNANIHGGGYGKDTEVLGNVTVNFGKIDPDAPLTHTVTPTLYGHLYGGSALGKVNTFHGNDSTTVNILNGTITKYLSTKVDGVSDSLVCGKAFGGGLGKKPTTSTSNDGVSAYVYGKVHVNVGLADDPDDQSTFTGQADLVECEVFGCNNQNGSPQKEVYVDVYQTYHIRTDSASYIYPNPEPLTYAISQVFGGGNESHYSTGSGIGTYVYVHKCENTAWRVFGAGNAADVDGVEIKIDGGRFDWVFGGGNGERGQAYAANILGTIHLSTGGGVMNYLVGGSNLNGTALSIIEDTYEGCSESEINNYFLGSNSDTIYGNIDAIISCEASQVRYVNLYCGSNLAPIYGNINVVIEGGIFDNVFGGSKGSLNNPNNPPGFETYASDIHDNPYTDELEGHVNLLIMGGTIGNLYGGCDANGNIDGKITLTIYDAEYYPCGFFIGNIYGGGNKTDYIPLNIADGSGSAYSPEIKILKGTIGGLSNKLPVHNPNHLTDTIYAGNVFGGGNEGNVGGLYDGVVKTSNPKVIIGNGKDNVPVTIEGNVFGGGRMGNVNGSPVVVVVPDTHELTVNQPESSVGVIRVTNCKGDNELNEANVATIGEDVGVNIKAIPSIYGYRFDSWEVISGNGTITNLNAASSTFIMKTGATTIKANFEGVGSEHMHTLTVNQPSEGDWITVVDGFGNPYISEQGNPGSAISEGAILYISVEPVGEYVFTGWVVTGEGASVGSLVSPTTTFTMGTENATLTATFRRQRSIR